MKAPVIAQNSNFICITFIDTGKSYVIRPNEERYSAVKEMVHNQNWRELESFLNPEKKFEKTEIGTMVTYEAGVLHYNGKPLHEAAYTAIFNHLSGIIPLSNVLNYIANIMECDNYTMLNELHLFLSSNEELPITEDGAFLAYRVVQNDYYSKHPNPDGTRNRNCVGDVVDMDRKYVNPDRRETCDSGLHFCSLSYVPKYGCNNDDRVMIVKIYPQDVVAIPYDYNNSKGRCCKYEVIGEVVNYQRNSDEFNQRAASTLHEMVTSKETLGQSVNEALDEEFEKHGDFEESEDFDDIWDNEYSDQHDFEETPKEEITSSIPSPVKFAVHNADDVKEQLRKIIDRQIESDYYNQTTARRVAKSTKNPYIPVVDVIILARELGYKVKINHNTNSESVITK